VFSIATVKWRKEVRFFRFERGRFGWWKETKDIIHYSLIIHLWVHKFPRLEQTILHSQLLNSKPNYPKNPSCLIWILPKKRFYKLRKKALEFIHQLRCDKTKPIILLGFVKSTPILHSQSVLLKVSYTPKDIRSSKKKFIIYHCANSVDIIILCTPKDM